jgi:hypothetical protein
MLEWPVSKSAAGSKREINSEHEKTSRHVADIKVTPVRHHELLRTGQVMG